VHDISSQVAVHQIPAPQDRSPEQAMWQVTSNPPQLIEPLHEPFPEQSSTVSIAPAAGFRQEPSPLQLTVHASPPQFDPAWQLLVPLQTIFVVGAWLETFNLQATAPAHSTMQSSPPHRM
jgi:hypothetical protein